MGINPVTVGIVGAGGMAREHIRAFSSLDSVDVCGIQSRTHSKAAALAQEFGIRHVAESLEELHETASPDILVVAVSASFTKEVAELAFNYPWTILLEKPAGCNLSEAKSIKASAEAANANVYVALNRRLMSSAEITLNKLNTDEKRFIHVQDQQSMAATHAAGHPEIIVRNLMYANSIHLIDYFSLLGRGEVTSVNNIHEWKGEKTSLMLSHIEFESGDEGLYQGVWQGPGPWAVTINTLSQRWELRPLESASLQVAGSREIHTFDQTSADTDYKPGFVRQAEETVKAHRKEANLTVTLAESFKSMELTSRIFEMD